jgi:hypothetical protein
MKSPVSGSKKISTSLKRVSNCQQDMISYLAIILVCVPVSVGVAALRKAVERMLTSNFEGPRTRETFYLNFSWIKCLGRLAEFHFPDASSIRSKQNHDMMLTVRMIKFELNGEDMAQRDLAVQAFGKLVHPILSRELHLRH